MEEREIIRSVCTLFACRCCRTRTGWAHQCWCVLPEVTEPDCADCRYYNAEKACCAHPSRKVVLRQCGKQKFALNATPASTISRS